MHLLLTTYPAHKSGNVGDSLISNSVVKLIRNRNAAFSPVVLFREQRLDAYSDGSIRSIVAPGFSVSEGVYPKLFGLYEQLDRLPAFYPIGCSFQHVTPADWVFDEHQYSQQTLDFLHFVVERSGSLPCRDILIANMLVRHGIPSVYSGDMALFDDDNVFKPFSPSAEIRSVVFTIQHHARYEEQSLEVLKAIKGLFPDAKLYVSYHSKPSVMARRVAATAVELGFSELHLYGDSNNLSVYRDIDLHIGYRLHGHIAFLRNRKPSILMVEDARSYGFSRTVGTMHGCFDAANPEGDKENAGLAEQLVEFMERQLPLNFSDYNSVFAFIDKTYCDFVSPYFTNMARNMALDLTEEVVCKSDSMNDFYEKLSP